MAETFFDHARVTEIAPRTGWVNFDLRELWAYRELLWVLVERDLRVRYKQTVLGVGWAVLRPVISIVIFTVVFGRLAKLPSDGVPYPIFSLAGVLPWTFFSTALAGATESFVGAHNLISKIYFPRLIMPLAALGTPLVDLVVGLVLLTLLGPFFGVSTWAGLAWSPLLLLAVGLATLGPAVWSAALTVVYRDVRHLMPFLIQAWLYATPVVYPASLVPERWRLLVYLNPVAGPVEAFRAAFLGRPYDGAGLAVSAGVSFLLLGTGLIYFVRVERRFADIV